MPAPKKEPIDQHPPKDAPERLQSLSQRSARLAGAAAAAAAAGGSGPGRIMSLSSRGISTATTTGGGLTRGRFAPKAVARRTKEERDSTAPEVKPVIASSSSQSSHGGNDRGSGRGGRGGRGGGGFGGRGRGRFEPVVSAAVGPLAAPSGVDPRTGTSRGGGGSRFSSPAIGGSSRTSPFGFDLSSVIPRLKSETPGDSTSGYSSRSMSEEVEEPNRIDMTQNSYIDSALSEYFPVRLDRRKEDDYYDEEEDKNEEEVEEEKENIIVKKENNDSVSEIEIKKEPTDEKTKHMNKSSSGKSKDNKQPVTTKRSEAAIFEEEQLRELRRMTHDHKVIAKEFNMEGKTKSKESSVASDESELDGLEEIEKRLYFFQFPVLVPEFIVPHKGQPPISPKESLLDESSDDDAVIVVDEKKKVSPATTTGVTPSMATTPQSTNGKTNASVTVSSLSTSEGKLPEGLIGKLRLHKSGKLTMVVGNITMDVSQGTECSFLQDVVVMDSEAKQAYLIGQVSKKMVLSPILDDSI